LLSCKAPCSINVPSTDVSAMAQLRASRNTSFSRLASALTSSPTGTFWMSSSFNWINPVSGWMLVTLKLDCRSSVFRRARRESGERSLMSLSRRFRLVSKVSSLRGVIVVSWALAMLKSRNSCLFARAEISLPTGTLSRIRVSRLVSDARGLTVAMFLLESRLREVN